MITALVDSEHSFFTMIQHNSIKEGSIPLEPNKAPVRMILIRSIRFKGLALIVAGHSALQFNSYSRKPCI